MGVFFLWIIGGCIENNKRRVQFAEKCYANNGAVLTNATGTAKARTYTYVCVRSDIIIDIKE